MNSVRRVFLVASLLVLVFDAVGAAAAAAFGFSYAALSAVSFLIYATAGFFAARSANVKAGVLVGAGVALVEATLGWIISWNIGPGRPPDDFQGVAPIIATIVFVVLTGALFGLAGGLLARWRRGPAAQAVRLLNMTCFARSR